MRTLNLDIYEGMPDRTMLKTPEIAKVFGYKNYSDIMTFVKRGYIPAPTTRRNSIKSPNSFGKHPHKYIVSRNFHYWTLGDLRKLKIKLDNKVDSNS